MNKTVSQIVYDMKEKKTQESKATLESQIPHLTEAFVEFFGTNPDRVKYNAQLGDLIFISGEDEFGCRAYSKSLNGYTENRWTTVFYCPTCNKRFYGDDYGVSSVEYINLDFPEWKHSHDQSTESKLRDIIREMVEDIRGE